MTFRILIIHNRYRMAGGEDSVVATESHLLRAFGHQVEEYYDSNEATFGYSDSLEPIWSVRTVRLVRNIIQEYRPDVVHCHNIYYRISPSVYWLCSNLGVPVVQTLHNFRIGCLNARLMRDGLPCELCLDGSLRHRNGILRGCFQNSRIKSTGLALSLYLHQNLGTFTGRVSKYIALSHFARTKHILAGVPESKIVVKPNCVYPDPGEKPNVHSYCLFVGRLELDKGIRVLLQAAALCPEVPVLIVGDGPLQKEVRDAVSTRSNVQYAGKLSRIAVIEAMKQASCLLFPSLAYENFPMTIAEAFSVGLPVIASNRGAAGEIVVDNVNGLLFEAGSATDLARRMRMAWTAPCGIEEMGHRARACYQQLYSGESTYRALHALYKDLVISPALATRESRGLQEEGSAARRRDPA